MVNYCYLCKIEYGSINDVSFHNLPKVPEIRDQWIAVIGKEVSKYASVCCQHFEEKDFIYRVFGTSVRRYLKPTSVPSRKIINDKRVKKVQDQTEAQHVMNVDYSQTTKDAQMLNNENSEDEDIYENFEEYDPDDLQNNDKVDRVDMKANNTEINNQNINASYDSLYTIDELDTIENDKCSDESILQRNNAARGNSKKRKRLSTPRFIGDLTRADFSSDMAWNLVRNFIKDSRKQEKFLTETLRKLSDKVKHLEAILDEVKRRQRSKCN